MAGLLLTAIVTSSPSINQVVACVYIIGVLACVGNWLLYVLVCLGDVADLMQIYSATSLKYRHPA